MSLPDFFVLGAPKAGTTALHAALARHPQLFMSPVKEPKFFLCDGPPPDRGGPGDAHSYREWIWRPDDYERLFDGAPPGTLRGESTPFYLPDFAAHERIHRAVPEARLVVILRDPVDRAYSNWAHLWADGLETDRRLPDRLRRRAARRAEAGWAPFWRYLATGLYGRQLRHLYGLFPRDQVLVLRYFSLVEEPRLTLDAVCRFLGVEEGVIDRGAGQERRRVRAPHALHEMPAGDIPARRQSRQPFPTAGLAQGQPPPPVADPADPPAPAGAGRVGPSPADRLLRRRHHHRGRGDRLGPRAWRTYREGGTYSVRKSWAPSRRLVS